MRPMLYGWRSVWTLSVWVHPRPGSHPPNLPPHKPSRFSQTASPDHGALDHDLDIQRTKCDFTRSASMEHVSYFPAVALHGLSSVDHTGAHYKDALRLGLPFHLEIHDQRLSCRRFSTFSFHGPLEVCDYAFEPAFIRKRNERERHRVRCVNEGYARLREHLPQEFEDKRLSKVETLRAAIDYIKHLQSLLDLNASGMEVSLGERAPPAQRTERNMDGDSKTDLRGTDY